MITKIICATCNVCDNVKFAEVCHSFLVESWSRKKIFLSYNKSNYALSD